MSKAEQPQLNNAELQVAAQTYWEQGLAIVPFMLGADGKKRPVVNEWGKWQTSRQTRKEFEALPWPKADGFAILCGQKLKNDLYLGAVDFDVNKLSVEVIEKGRKVLKQLPITKTEETPSGGQHLIYYLHNEPKTISIFHNECALELLGTGKLCIRAPSRGSKGQNDNTPIIISDLEDTLYKALYNAGIKLEKKNETWFTRKFKTEAYKGKDPSCILELEKGTKEGLRNEHGIRLASYYVNFKKYSPELSLQNLKLWNKQNTPVLEETELLSLLNSTNQGKYDYGCTDNILKNLCNR